MTVQMMGKGIRLELTERASRQLEAGKTPSYVEMELYFSCLSRKALHIRDEERKTKGDVFLTFTPISCGSDAGQ